MKRLVVCALLAFGVTQVALAADGLDISELSATIRPQDDLFNYVNGQWLKSAAIPSDRAWWGVVPILREQSQKRQIELLETSHAGGDAQKAVDLYKSFVDEKTLEKKGMAPLKRALSGINALKDASQIAPLMVQLEEVGISGPTQLFVTTDAKDSSREVVQFYQGGLGLPDRDFYLSDDAKFVEIRKQYLAHMGRLLALAGESGAPARAAAVLKFETALAQVTWTPADNRDPVKTYNKRTVAELKTMAPQIDWDAYFRSALLSSNPDYVVVFQPSQLTGVAQLMTDMPIAVWRDYFRLRLISTRADELPKRFDQEEFAFTGKVLNGVPAQLPRKIRGALLVDAELGEALGQLYVAKYFPPDVKARMLDLVKHLLAAYRADIERLDWMGPETKKEAQAKIDKINVKIGYPDQFRDYSSVQIRTDDLFGNVERTSRYEYQRGLNKLGKPVDHKEWQMTPQTVNAYYSPRQNEIVFPAAILQPPVFNPAADDAVNYGAAGSVIGHEISHGFDDSGSHFDASGNLRDWWTAEDHARFAKKTEAMVTEYNGFEALPGFPVNGQLTLGENIADNAGATIAYQAYISTLAGAASPTIDGLTGEQRFWIAYAIYYRFKLREAFALNLVKSDPHSPGIARVNGVAVNQPGFYEAFHVKPGDKLYRAPAERIELW